MNNVEGKELLNKMIAVLDDDNLGFYYVKSVDKFIKREVKKNSDGEEVIKYYILESESPISAVNVSEDEIIELCNVDKELIESEYAAVVSKQNENKRTM